MCWKQADNDVPLGGFQIMDVGLELIVGMLGLMKPWTEMFPKEASFYSSIWH